MSVTKRVNKIVTNNVTEWSEALTDAKKRLAQAQKEVACWKGVIQICHKRIEAKAPWPGQVQESDRKRQANG